MSRGNGAALRVAPSPAQAFLQDELSHAFWNDATALSWVTNPRDGLVQVSATHPAPTAAPATPVPHHELANRLRRSVQLAGHRPLRTIEDFPGPDGRPHQFLVIGFPLAAVDGAPHTPMAGVAINITHHRLRVEQLAQQALIDELTGLYNLRGFFLFAEHELKVARRRGTRCAILYIDVDGLKQTNDTRGHQRGNAVLAETGALLRRAFRESDVIARLGGDEFAVFAADVRDPRQLRRRLARALALAASAGAEVPTLSAGVGSLPSAPGLQVADLLIAADQAMYKEKFKRLEQRPGSAGTAPGP